MVATSPLYRDPLDDGAADPTVVWNPDTGEWWMLYTSRRTGDPRNGVGWVHGTDIGIAVSTDHGATWRYRGIASGLEAPGDWGRNTYWAPEVIRHDGRYHMYLTYLVGVPTVFAGERIIRHYTSSNLHEWEYQSDLQLSSAQVIDACVYALPGGGWRLWYKDEADDNNIWAADSDDLFAWRVSGPAIRSADFMEGPYVFSLDGSYWMLVDSKRQLLFRSDDLETWTHVDTVLDVASGAASDRVDDTGPGLHAMALVAGTVAWVIYFTHPDRALSELPHPDIRRSSIQVASLTAGGTGLVCHRDSGVAIDLTLAERG